MRPFVAASVLALVAQAGRSIRPPREVREGHASSPRPCVALTRSRSASCVWAARRGPSYPQLDSALWTSTDKTPPIARVLAFDDDDGWWIDRRRRHQRRSGAARPASRHHDARAETRADSRGEPRWRSDPTDSLRQGAWCASHRVELDLRFPGTGQRRGDRPDGSILILSDSGQATTVWHVRPPETTIADTATVPHALRTVRTPMGDRLYLAVSDGLIALRSRDLAPTPPIRLDRPVRAAVTTPSGDRIYVADDRPPSSRWSIAQW